MAREKKDAPGSGEGAPPAAPDDEVLAKGITVAGGAGDAKEGENGWDDDCPKATRVVAINQGACPPIPVTPPLGKDGKPAPLPISGPFDDEGNPTPVPVAVPRDQDGNPTPLPVVVPTPVPVSLQRSAASPSDDQALWVAIRDRTNAIGFDAYSRFIDRVLCEGASNASERREIDPEERYRRQPPVYTKPDEDGNDRKIHLAGKTDNQLHFGVDAYQLLKAATQAFLILRCGVRIKSFDADDEQSRLGRKVTKAEIRGILTDYLQGGGLPYLQRILGVLHQEDTAPSPFCDTLLTGKPFDPCLLELLWSYWHEEGMMVQAIHAVSLRFQNKRTAGEREPMAELELSPLRPLSNLIWGYVQDEPFRLTVARRTYEYLHHYGLSLRGRALPSLKPAESRSQFLEAFHSLLYQTAQFYEKDSDTTVIADGFPVLNGLKEIHMLLAEGAHNQFGDLPWTARAEMLIQQWLLSRREMKEFLRGRQMVPYKETWMGQVDTVKRLYGWTDTPVTHFHDLADYGEKILLSVRYGDWIGINDQERAKNWARYFKPEVQSYIHAYRVATGVDLTASMLQTQPVNATPPALLLQQRLAQQQRAR